MKARTTKSAGPAGTETLPQPGPRLAAADPEGAIRAAAHPRAGARGFEPGCELLDWLAAERAVDLGGGRASSCGGSAAALRPSARRGEMQHARDDYDRIQDPSGLIPDDEPVFLQARSARVGQEEGGPAHRGCGRSPRPGCTARPGVIEPRQPEATMAKDKDQEKKAETKPAGRTRAVTPWDPWDQMERFMDELLPGRWMQRWGPPAMGELLAGLQAPTPSVDVIDRDEEVVVKAEIPGVRKENVEVSLTDNTLTLSGHTESEEKEEKESFFRREIRRGEFSRTLTLPASVDTEHAKASFEDGVLVVTVPKITKTARRRVDIT
jgi:HSP20 family protein